MKTRKKAYGNYNMVGRNIERMRRARGITQRDFVAQMQVAGCDINPTSYSKLEGQLRNATDREVYAAARILGVPMETLFTGEEDE